MSAVPAIMPGHWWPVRDGDARARTLFRRHYSYKPYRDGRNPAKIAGPGEYMMLLTLDCLALFCWKKFIDPSGQQGINCSVFRNEGPMLSSALIHEACDLAWSRWPGERLYTYVNPRKVASRHPGWCFICAGFRKCGITAINRLIILERLP